MFDRFPALQLILGHMGEVLPFMIERASGAFAGASALGTFATGTELTVAEYFRRNFYISTSGLFTNPPLCCALEVLGADRIIFAVDHPFANSARGREFLEQAPLDEDTRTKIAHGNADRLLGLM